LCIADDMSKTSKAFHIGQPVGRHWSERRHRVCNLTWKTDCHIAIGRSGPTALLGQSELIFS
jgi:hypothetical protein